MAAPGVLSWGCACLLLGAGGAARGLSREFLTQQLDFAHHPPSSPVSSIAGCDRQGEFSFILSSANPANRQKGPLHPFRGAGGTPRTADRQVPRRDIPNPQTDHVSGAGAASEGVV